MQGLPRIRIGQAAVVFGALTGAHAFGSDANARGPEAPPVIRLESGSCSLDRSPALASSATLVRVGGKIFAVASFNGAVPANAPEACHWATLPDGRRVALSWIAGRWDLGLSVLAPDGIADQAAIEALPELTAETKIGRGNPPRQIILRGRLQLGPAEQAAFLLNRASSRHFFASIESVYEARPAAPLDRTFAGGAATGPDGTLWGILSNQAIAQVAAAAARTARLPLISSFPLRPMFETAIVVPSSQVSALLADATAGARGQLGVGRVRPTDVAQGKEAVQLAGLSFQAACPDPSEDRRPSEEFPIGGSGNGFGIGGDEGNPNCRIDVDFASGEGGAADAGTDAAPGEAWPPPGNRSRHLFFERLRAARAAAPRLALWFSYENEPALKPFGLRDVGDFFQQLAMPRRSFVYDSPFNAPILATEAPDLHREAHKLIGAFFAFRSFARTAEPYVFGRLLRSPGWRDVGQQDMDAFLDNVRTDRSLHLDVLVAAERVFHERSRAVSGGRP